MHTLVHVSEWSLYLQKPEVKWLKITYSNVFVVLLVLILAHKVNPRAEIIELILCANPTQYIRHCLAFGDKSY